LRERTPRDVRSQKEAETRAIPGGALSSIRGMGPSREPLAPQPVTEIIFPPSCLTPCPGSPLATYDVVAALDGEWCAAHDQRNLILSYQWTALYQSDVHQWCLSEGIYFPETGERLTGAQFLGKVLASFGFGYRTAAGKRILLVAHNSLADLAAFADRERFCRSFKEVRPTLVTIGRDVRARAAFASRHSAKVQLGLVDTMLLAPQKAQSLKHIGAYTRHKKLEIGDRISRMDAYLAQDPEGFIAYAINDCRVALEYLVQ